MNDFFKEEANDFGIEPISFEEVKKYYDSDAKMWALFQKVRKFDRFLKTKVFRKQYPFYLPGEIKR